MFFNKLKYKYKIMCIEVQFNNIMFNTCNMFEYIFKLFISLSIYLITNKNNKNNWHS
jgi:hypothetical protein